MNMNMNMKEGTELCAEQTIHILTDAAAGPLLKEHPLGAALATALHSGTRSTKMALVSSLWPYHSPAELR